MEGEEKDDDEGELKEGQPYSNEMANAAPPQPSTVEFRQHTDPCLSLNQEQSTLIAALQSENDFRVRPPSSPGGLMKRRNSNLANCEKILQEMNSPLKDASRRKRGESEAILEFAEEVYEDNEEESRTRAQSDPGEEGSCNQEDQSEFDGHKKPEDPNQALLQYFAKLSNSVGVEESLDLEHIRSLLRKGASVNTSDRFGQTLLHEVSRTWGVDVAKFFIEEGKARVFGNILTYTGFIG